MSASYCWLITADRLAENDRESAVGAEGPSSAPAMFGDDWTPRQFRMYDDDGVLCYDGILFAEDPDSEEACFGPLDDFGAPNAGCTRIDYFNGRDWETA